MTNFRQFEAKEPRHSETISEKKRFLCRSSRPTPYTGKKNVLVQRRKNEKREGRKKKKKKQKSATQ